MEPEEIRARASAAGLTLRGLADRVGMSENHLSKSLARKRRFTVPEMDALRLALSDDKAEPDREPIRTIPLLGEVPAGRFKPAEQTGGRRLPVSDPETPRNAYALIVKGDSMDLIVPDGSTLVIDPDDKALWPGRRFIIRTDDGETTFKEYQGDPARLVPCSSNPDHVEMLLGDVPITVLGRVFSYSMRDVPRRAT